MLLFNRYEYQPSTDLIGKGELSRVYKAMDKELSRPVAVKIYRGSDRLEKVDPDKAASMLSLDHPNICRYLHIEDIEREGAFGEPEKMQVCVQELVTGVDLLTYCKAHPDTTIWKGLVADFLRGLDYLHSQGLIHRRIKAANLLVNETESGPVGKITDFGLGTGQAASPETNHAAFSSIVVAVYNMAPEQFNARKYGVEGKITFNIDFWSLGLAIYHCITGDILFKNDPEDSREQVIANILDPQPSEKLRRMPAPFDRLVARCVVKQATERVQSGAELLSLLGQGVGEQAEAADEEEGDVRDTLVWVRPLPAQAPPMATPAIEPEANDTRVLPAGDDTRVLPAGDDTRVLPAALERPPAPPMRSEENHNLFNRYEYNPRTGLIGRGGFSRVYKAFDKKLNRWVALKIYKTGEFSDRYSPIAEIRRVVNLDHPNICRYLDIEEIEKENAFGEREQTQICVMELLDGGTLLEYYTAHPTENVLRKLLTDVLNGLAYLHKNGIIHRDIKPANILIRETYDGPVAKITDFGISKLSDSVNNQSSSALVVSIPYMAPEQLNVRKYGMQEKISFNLDLWALGVTIYEIMTGKILFKNTDQDSSEQIMTNIVSSGIPEKIAELPQPFVDIVRRCVVKDARERVQKADELIILLNRTLPERTAAAHTSRQLPASKPAPDDKPVPPDEKPVAPNEKTVAPDDKAAPVPPRSFSVIGEEETEVKKKPRRGQEQWVIYLRIAVVAAALLLGISLYIYVQNRRLKEAMTFASPKADSVAIVDQPAVSPGSGGSAVSGGAGAVTAAPAAPARTDSGTRTPGAQKQAGQGGTAGSAGNAGNTANAGTGTGAGSGANAVSDSGQAMKKVHRNADRKKDRLSEPAGEDGKYVVLLTATQTCSITINNISYGTLKSGKAMWVRLGPGSYVIQATDAENGAPPYTGRLEVKPTDLNQVGKIKIPL